MNSAIFLSRISSFAVALAAAAVVPAQAANHQAATAAPAAPASPTTPGAAGAPASTAAMTTAEVRRVDKEGGRVTLRHAPIQNLDMPAMTMVFNVKDKAMLNDLKAGDKVRFKAIIDAGKYIVTDLQMGQ